MSLADKELKISDRKRFTGDVGVYSGGTIPEKTDTFAQDNAAQPVEVFQAPIPPRAVVRAVDLFSRVAGAATAAIFRKQPGNTVALAYRPEAYEFHWEVEHVAGLVHVQRLYRPKDEPAYWLTVFAMAAGEKRTIAETDTIRTDASGRAMLTVVVRRNRDVPR